MANVLFKHGTYAQYKALEVKDANTLYFLTDVKELYKGSDLYSAAYEVIEGNSVSNLPTSGAQGRLYIFTEDKAIMRFNGTSFVNVLPGIAAAIDGSEKLVTAKLVKEYVEGQVSTINGAIALKANSADVYTKGEADALLAEKAVKSEVETAIKGVQDGVAANLASIGEINTALGTKANAADVYTKGEVDAKVSAVYRFKGTVSNYAALPTEGNIVGDVYNVTESGVNYAWAIDEAHPEGFWDSLSGVVDLSGYYTNEQVDSKIKEVTDVLTPHVGNGDIHVTAEKKAEWDAKATTDAVATAKGEAIAAAKEYTDAEIKKIDEAYKLADEGLAGRIQTLETAGYATISQVGTAKQEAIEAAAQDATTKVNTLANGQVATNAAAIEAINNAETGILKQAQNYADQAELDAIATAAGDATSKADKALLDAKAYVDAALTWNTIA